METYQKREGTSAILGQWYEIKIIMLIFIQAIIAGFKFKLANNLDLAGDFDDVVINVLFPDSASKTVFLQAKHFKNPNKKKITLTDLNATNGRFSLFKYFNSYKKIMENKTELFVKGLNVDDAEYVIYTNTDFDETSADNFEENVAFNETLTILKSNDVSAFKIKPSNIANFLELFPASDKKLVNEYLGKLTFLVQQGNESEVEDKIQKCISVKFNEMNQKEIRDNYLKSYNEYQTWWKSEGKVKFLTQDDNYFQNIFSRSLLDKLNSLTSKIINDVSFKCIEFKDSCLHSFSVNIPDTGSVEILTTPGASMLTVAKVLQFFKGQQDIMFVNSECVKQFSDKIQYNFLQCKILNTLVYHVSEKKPESEQFVTNMLNIVKINFNKRFIVICDEQIGCIKSVPRNEIKFCDLSAEAQEFVEKRNIKFQGKEMCVNDVLNNCEMLSDELLAQVLLQELVQIANGQIVNLKKLHYIPRKFKKQLVDTDVIDKCKDDVLLIQTSDNDCRHTLCSGSEVRFYPKTDPKRKNVYYILPSNDKLTAFHDLFEKSKNVHLFEFNNKELRWLKSHGSIKLVIKNLKGHDVLTESEIVNCCNRDHLVVISDVAGMGKTTVLKSLVNIVNKQYPELWILKINLSQHTEELHKIKETNAKQSICETILNLLSYSSEINKRFLSLMLAAGRVAVFLDGFDEISPDYEEIVINLVKELRDTNVQQIYLTTRPQMKKYISENLYTLSYTFVALETEEQVHFVSSEWLRNKNYMEEDKQDVIISLAHKLIAKISSLSSQQDISICGIPLQLRMIVDIYPTIKEGKTILKNDEFDITLKSLYENFLNKKMHVYCEEKIEIPPSSVAFKNELKRHKDALEEHQLIAIDMIFSGSNHDIMVSEKDQAKLVQIMDSAHEITRYGIVSAVHPRHSVFTHQTFAEYFSAMYLISRLEKRKCKKFIKMFVREVLTKMKYHVLRKFLNSMVEKLNTCRPLLSFKILYRVRFYCNVMVNLSWMPLHVAAKEKNMNLLKYFLHDLVPRLKTTKLILNSYYDEFTVLQILVKSSVSREYLDEIELLVSFGADVYLRTKDGKSILHLSGNNIYVLERLLRVADEESQLQKLLQNDALLGAVLLNNLECVKLLISYQASVNWKDNNNSTFLHMASSSGGLDIVKCLVEHGANGNEKDNAGRSVLNVAASNGHLNIVKYLLKHGANVYDLDNDGRSVLYVAASNGHLDIVKYLVSHSAHNVNDKDNAGESVLYRPASNGLLDIGKYLVSHSAHNVNDKDNAGESVLYRPASNGLLDIGKYLVEHGSNVKTKDKAGRSVLNVAASNGHLNIVKYLVEHRANNVNDKDNAGRSVLYVAASNGQLDIFKYLLEHGSNVKTKDKAGRSVLNVAASNGHLNIVKYLVEHGANVNDKDNAGRSVLYVAASKIHLRIVKYLVENGANVNVKNIAGWSVLYLAASNGHLDIVKYLVERGANVNDKDISGWSVLHMAASNDYLEIVKYLLEHCANVNDKDIAGRSVLNVAASNDHLDIVKYLVEQGANVNDKDNASRSVLYMAASNGHLDIIKYLVKHGANVNDKDNDGWAVLHMVVKKNHLDIVKYLVEQQGANVNDKDNVGRSVLHVAAKSGNLDTVIYLVEHGANVIDKDNGGRSALDMTYNREATEYLCVKGAM